MKWKRIKKPLFICFILALVLTSTIGGQKVSAKTMTKKITIKTRQKKKIFIKVSKVKKIKAKSSKKSIATVKSIGKKAIWITGKKAGKAVITVKITTRKRKIKTIKYKVTVKKKSSKKTDSKNDVKPEQSEKPTKEEMTATPRYTYELKIMNRKNLYNHATIAVYIKTDNPDPSAFYADCGTAEEVKHEDKNGVCYMTEDEFQEIISPKAYADVHYTDGNNAVNGGYLCMYEWDTPGKKNFTIREKVGTAWVDAAKMEIELKNKEQAELEWIQAVMAEMTDETMTNKEKLDSLTQYILDNFKYDRNNEQGPISLLKDEGVYWERKYIDCWDATHIMSLFAEQLGLKSRATYAGYGVHYYATVTIEGKDYDFDACPMSETGWTTEWEYVL